MVARNPIQEILEIRSRLRYGDSFSEFSTRLIHLEAAYGKKKEVDLEFLSYFPVALVACFEGFFRLASKELMDAGPPYIGNAGRLGVTMKFDLESVVALHGKRTTIGEIIAHHLSWNNLAQVEANMSAILGKSFLDGVRGISNRVATEIYGRPPEHRHVGLEQSFVLEGSLVDADGACTAGNYVWRRAGSVHNAWSPDGCIVLGIFGKPNEFLA